MNEDNIAKKLREIEEFCSKEHYLLPIVVGARLCVLINKSEKDCIENLDLLMQSAIHTKEAFQLPTVIERKREPRVEVICNNGVRQWYKIYDFKEMDKDTFERIQNIEKIRGRYKNNDVLLAIPTEKPQEACVEFTVESPYLAFDQNGHELNFVLPQEPEDIITWFNNLTSQGVTRIDVMPRRKTVDHGVFSDFAKIPYEPPEEQIIGFPKGLFEFEIHREHRDLVPNQPKKSYISAKGIITIDESGLTPEQLQENHDKIAEFMKKNPPKHIVYGSKEVMEQFKRDYHINERLVRSAALQTFEKGFMDLYACYNSLKDSMRMKTFKLMIDNPDMVHLFPPFVPYALIEQHKEKIEQFHGSPLNEIEEIRGGLTPLELLYHLTNDDIYLNNDCKILLSNICSKLWFICYNQGFITFDDGEVNGVLHVENLQDVEEKVEAPTPPKKEDDKLEREIAKRTRPNKRTLSNEGLKKTLQTLEMPVQCQRCTITFKMDMSKFKEDANFNVVPICPKCMGQMSRQELEQFGVVEKTEDATKHGTFPAIKPSDVVQYEQQKKKETRPPYLDM